MLHLSDHFNLLGFGRLPNSIGVTPLSAPKDPKIQDNCTGKLTLII